MTFNNSYFLDEIRNDFFIPSMVKRSWAAGLQILSDLDQVCKKHGITYFAEWGTLLGAIRHGGYIPWDDDLDICMKRSDYNKFLEIVPQELPSHTIVNYKSNENYTQMLSRLVNSDHYRFDQEFLSKYAGLPFVMGIDIFPLDFISGDENYEQGRVDRAYSVLVLLDKLTKGNQNPSNLDLDIKNIEALCNTEFDLSKSLVTQLRSILESIYSEVSEENAKYITLYPIWLENHSYVFPKEYYARSMRVPFECIDIPIPLYYHDILTKKYGQSYITPVRSGGAHNYPYYTAHIDVLREHFNFEWPHYEFLEADILHKTSTPDTTIRERYILVITHSAQAYSFIKPIINEYEADNNNIVMVMPIPHTEISTDLQSHKEVFDIDCYPEEAILTDYHDFDSSLYFDTIITTYPYDGYDLLYLPDIKYHSTNIRNMCNELIFIPPYDIKQIPANDNRSFINLKSYLKHPLLALCDKIIVTNQNIKDTYIKLLDELTEFKYHNTWEDKIYICAVLNTPSTVIQTNKPKILMYYIGINEFLTSNQQMLAKLSIILDTFVLNKDNLNIIYKEQSGLRNILEFYSPILYKSYLSLISKYTDTNISFDYLNDNITHYASICDAYYGSVSSFIPMFTDSKKPVMLQNPDIL